MEGRLYLSHASKFIGYYFCYKSYTAILAAKGLLEARFGLGRQFGRPTWPRKAIVVLRLRNGVRHAVQRCAIGLCQLVSACEQSYLQMCLPPRAGKQLQSQFDRLAMSGKSMSCVSDASVKEVVQSLGLQWVNGNEVDPLQPPFTAVADFATHEYPTEPRADHLQVGLWYSVILLAMQCPWMLRALQIIKTGIFEPAVTTRTSSWPGLLVVTGCNQCRRQDRLAESGVPVAVAGGVQGR